MKHWSVIGPGAPEANNKLPGADGVPLYTVLSNALHQACSHGRCHAGDNAALLSELYDISTIKQFRNERRIAPHFKMSAINYILGLVQHNTRYIAEVTFSRDDLLNKEYPGQPNSGSRGTSYQGYCVESIKVIRTYSLRDEADILALTSLGLFDNEETSPHDRSKLSTLLLENKAYDLYFRLQGVIPQAHSWHLHWLVAHGNESLVRMWLDKVDIDPATICGVLTHSKTSPITDVLFQALQAKKAQPRRIGNSVLDAVAYHGYWVWLPGFVGEFATAREFETWLSENWAEVPPEALTSSLLLFYPRTLPEEARKRLILFHKTDVIDALVEKRLISDEQIDDVINWLLLAGLESYVEHLDSSQAFRTRVQERQLSRSGHPDEYSKVTLEVAIAEDRWFAATRHKIPEKEKIQLNAAVVKATEKGFLGLIRWFDQQGVDVRPHDNITSRIARTRGYDVLADYLEK